MDKDLSKIKRDLGKLLRSQPLAVLATQNQGQPYASLVAFVSSDDMKSLYFATTRSTRKYANLSVDSRVAMLVDNRSNKTSSDDQRPWYLSLHRSFDNLRSLRSKIETELIPRMEKEAHEMSLMDLSA